MKQGSEDIKGTGDMLYKTVVGVLIIVLATSIIGLFRFGYAINNRVTTIEVKQETIATDIKDIKRGIDELRILLWNLKDKEDGS